MKRILLLTAGLIATASRRARHGRRQDRRARPDHDPDRRARVPQGRIAVPCYIILTRMTAVQTLSDGVSYPTTVKQDGWIVAFTVGLSKLSTRRPRPRRTTSTLSTRPTAGRPDGDHRAQARAQEQVHGRGREPDLPSRFRSWARCSGAAVAPTTASLIHGPAGQEGRGRRTHHPTWAPVLSYNLNTSKFAYRQSRREQLHPRGRVSDGSADTVGSAASICAPTPERASNTA